MAEGDGKRWLLGCALGCGALILLGGVLLVGGGVLFVRNTTRGFDAAVELRDQLETRHGRVDTFTPWPEGPIPAARLETFLAVREATTPTRTAITLTFASFPASEEQARELEAQPFLDKMRSVLDLSRSAMGLGAELGRFFEQRNQALLDADMGMGEYTYLYTLAYHAWLGHRLGEGPGNVSVTVDETGQVQEQDAPGAVAVDVGGGVSARVRRDLRAMLRNQLEALGPAADPVWREALARESAALEADPGRLPWQDGLPPSIVASLKPFRERLAATYSPMTNPFELARNRREGRFSIRAE